jgi:RIP metalloprotease RseP
VTATTERTDHAEEPGAAPAASSGVLPLLVLLGGLVLLGIRFGPAMIVLVLGFLGLIFFHELGHYLVAKRSGMKVTEFFLGFGPHIWSFQRGETRYGLKAIPAGAYVKIIGMHNLDEVDPADEARTYRRQSFPRRLATVLAGPGANLLLATVLIGVLLVGVGLPVRDAWQVGAVSERSAAAAAGLQPGDRVLSLDGVAVSSFEDLFTVVADRAGREVPMVVERDGEVVTLTAPVGERLTAEGAAGFEVLGRGSLFAGDRILAVDGAETTYPELYASLERGVLHRLLVDDGTEIGEVRVRVGDLAPPGGAVTGFLGVRPETPLETVSVVEAPWRAVETSASLVKEAVVAIGRFFTPGSISSFVQGATETDREVTAVSQRPVADPSDENRILSIVGALNLGNELADDGWEGLLYFFVTINVFLALFNLLPLLPFDGGHAVVAVYERLRSFGGREYRVDIRKLMPVTYAVVSMFVFLAVIALFRDIMDPVQL